MAFQKDEIQVETDADVVGAVICLDCGYKSGIEPDERFTPEERLLCGGCCKDLGTWSAHHDALYGDATRLLNAVLTSRPAPPAD